ncbi:MAG TPA: thiol reductant ABC exporter subunit CydD [Streptosporangiaceae bacterium]|nr:thiol reductant ABC exporter subunit CydD [Gaiellales bacterium]
MRALDPRLLGRAGGARVALGADVVFGLFTTVVVVAQAVLFADVVTAAFEGGVAARSIALLAVAVAVRAVLATAYEVTGRWAAARVMSGLRRELTERRLRDAPVSETGAEAGEVATAAVQGVDALETYFARYLPQVVLAVLVPVVILAAAAALDPLSGAIMLVTLPLIPVFMALIGRFTEARTRDRWQALARLSNHFLDVVRGLPTLRAYNRGAAQAARIEAIGEEYRAATMRVLRLSFLSGAVLDLVATIATALVAVTLGVRLIEGAVTLRAALIVLLLTPELYAPLRALAAQYHASADGLAAADRILDLIDAAGEARRDSVRTGCPPWRAIRLDGVSVCYPGRPGPALDRFDLELRRGEITALVGPSGAGKSTVAALLLGLRRPDAGAVIVGSVTPDDAHPHDAELDDADLDDADLDTVDRRAWRREIAWLPQRPTLFRGSVLDNITMGCPEATTARAREAAALAGADDFVRDLRYGYRTRVGPGGQGLSAGETRRIALARALVRDAPLLILDEPTAHLDADAAAVVTDAIRRVAHGRAVLLIDHRPAAALIADRVVRLDAGRAVEQSAQWVP